MRIIVTGGGTGGHIYPALALIRRIKELNSNAEFLFVGTHKGLESKIVPQAGIAFKTIEIQGFKRKLSKDNIQTVRLFLKSIRESKKIIQAFKPDVVIGTGGYVCGAVVYAAAKLNIPTILHEQNSVPGITNKFLSRYVDKICVCFPEIMSQFPAKKVVYTGNPRGQEVASIKKSDILATFGLDPEIMTVLIFGGSRGAAKINDAFQGAISDFVNKPYQVLYVSGEIYYNELSAKIDTLNLNMKRVAVLPYLKNMDEVLPNVSLVVSRAGATTISEVTALGVPSILVPSPNVTNDHQTKNAESLVNAGAAIMIPDYSLSASKLIHYTDQVMTDSEKRKSMAKSSKDLGMPDATDRVIDIIMELTT